MKKRYAVDNTNRLMIKRPARTLTVHGRFGIDKNNELYYWLNEPRTWQKENSLPSRINFQGTWQLNKNYDLELRLHKTTSQCDGDSLVIKGEIISVDRDTLVFEVKSYDKDGLLHIQLLKLSGFWQADEHNRLTFLAQRKIQPDTIILESAWQIDKRQQIVYAYEKTNLKTKTKNLHTVTFTGFWQISRAQHLTYILTHSTKSRFDFRVQIESPNLYPQRGVIKYRLGIGLREEANYKLKIIFLYGAWKFSRNTGLSFNMDYGAGMFKKIEFGANVNLNRKDEIAFSLINQNGEPLGINVTFTHKFLQKLDAAAFLSLKKAGKEGRIEAGVRVPF